MRCTGEFINLQQGYQPLWNCCLPWWLLLEILYRGHNPVRNSPHPTSIAIMSFEQLPWEIRTMIYDWVHIMARKPNIPVRIPTQTHPKAYEVAREQFFLGNTVNCLVSENQLFLFLHSIGPQGRQTLSRLITRIGPHSKKCFTPASFELLRECTGLMYLRLHWSSFKYLERETWVPQLLDFNGLTEVSITYPRSQAIRAEKTQPDAEPVGLPNPGIGPRVEMQNQAADELRARWLTHLPAA